MIKAYEMAMNVSEHLKRALEFSSWLNGKIGMVVEMGPDACFDVIMNGLVNARFRCFEDGRVILKDADESIMAVEVAHPVDYITLSDAMIELSLQHLNKELPKLNDEQL